MATEDFQQLMLYARDLATVVRESRDKDSQLQATNDQLLKFAEDMSKTFTGLKRAFSDMEAAYLDTIHRLSLAAEYKDEDTGEHLARMSNYSALLAEKLGLADKQVQDIRYAAPMHDIGKIGIPDAILLKKGRLTAEEFDVIKTHTTIGGEILARSDAAILQLAETIARTHHEKWNGTGYPAGLAGEQIPIEGRIVALADVFDALTSKRPYKEAYPLEKAVDIVQKDSGSHFDPRVADAFLAHLDEVQEIMTGVQPAGADTGGNLQLSERDR
jgi:putative two-component system response regulator